MFQKYFLLVLSTLTRIIGYIPAAIYGYVYSQFFTKATYQLIGERTKKDKSIKNVLDIGTATGHPLFSIVQSFGAANVVGIDINSAYINSCKKLFQEKPNVEIKHMNFYDLEKEYAETQFDVIIFGSSFMLMPDQTKAIQIAKRKLTRTGRIYFLLTLYDERNIFNRFMELIKPYLKYLSTVDFGKVTYRADFQAFLKEHNLNPTLKDRCSGNFWLKYFKFYIYEVQVQQ